MGQCQVAYRSSLRTRDRPLALDLGYLTFDLAQMQIAGQDLGERLETRTIFARKCAHLP